MMVEQFRDFCVGGLKMMIMVIMICDDVDDENGGLLHLPMNRIVKQFGECFCVCLLG